MTDPRAVPAPAAAVPGGRASDFALIRVALQLAGKRKHAAYAALDRIEADLSELAARAAVGTLDAIAVKELTETAWMWKARAEAAEAENTRLRAALEELLPYADNPARKIARDALAADLKGDT